MQLVACRCGCGGQRERFDSRGREHFYINGHQMRGKHRSDRFKAHMSKIMTGHNHPNWVADRSLVGRHGLGFQKSQIKRLLKDRCDACCAAGKMNLDHIVPVLANGKPVDSNAQTLCVPCNQRKRVEELAYYKKLGEFRGTPRSQWGNPEPSRDGNVSEGATTRSRTVKNKRQPARVLVLVCVRCRNSYAKLERHFRPDAKGNFCGMSCRTAYFNTLRNGGNAPKSAQQAVGGAAAGRYSLGLQVIARNADKEPRDNNNSLLPGVTMEERSSILATKSAPIALRSCMIWPRPRFSRL